MGHRTTRADRFEVVSLVAIVIGLLPLAEVRVLSAPVRSERTRVSIKDTRWHLNGRPTYPETQVEGLLMNVRMVNSVFEDRERTEFDAEKNTDRFIATIPDYAAQGVRAFTLNLQGGFPGYEGAVNSAFNPDGSLRKGYLQRVKRVIETCDRNGVVVILGCYYQRQDQIIRLAKKTSPKLPVSTSGLGDGRLPDNVAQASDFLLIHFNGTKLDDIPKRIQALKKYGKPIVCNEDGKAGRREKCRSTMRRSISFRGPGR